MEQLYLCRHGETEWSLSGQHTGKTDLPLTKKGKEQAALLRKRLEGLCFEKIFSSPRKRAVETAQGLHPTLDPLLAEWDYGDYEGLTSQEIQLQSPGWNLFEKGAPGGESVADVGKRADDFLQKAQKYTGNVLVFSHGHFLRVLAARSLGLQAQKGRLFSLSVASVGIIGKEKGIAVISLWNSTDHLQGY